MESQCIVCGKLFEAKNAKGVLCSPSCRSRNHRKIKKERLFLLSNNSNFSSSPISVNQIQLNHVAINNYCIENNCTWEDLLESHKKFKAASLKDLDGSLRNNPNQPETYLPAKKYTMIEYNQRIYDATGFEQDLKEIEKEIRADKFITPQQRLMLLRSMGAAK